MRGLQADIPGRARGPAQARCVVDSAGAVVVVLALLAAIDSVVLPLATAALLGYVLLLLRSGVPAAEPAADEAARGIGELEQWLSGGRRA
jgi:hypothetical protein